MKDLLHELDQEIIKVQKQTAELRWSDGTMMFEGDLAYLDGKRAGLILAHAIVRQYDES